VIKEELYKGEGSLPIDYTFEPYDPCLLFKHLRDVLDKWLEQQAFYDIAEELYEYEEALHSEITFRPDLYQQRKSRKERELMERELDKYRDLACDFIRSMVIHVWQSNTYADYQYYFSVCDHDWIDTGHGEIEHLDVIEEFVSLPFHMFEGHDRFFDFEDILKMGVTLLFKKVQEEAIGKLISAFKWFHPRKSFLKNDDKLLLVMPNMSPWELKEMGIRYYPGTRRWEKPFRV